MPSRPWASCPAAKGPLVHGLPIFSFSPRRGSREVLVAYRENEGLHVVVDQDGSVRPEKE
ncbi:hypothetical protein [Corallococcus carmarthensis]|uniref:Uncharacterized protein n=1 Tax=Corallococcus carmarthensis TaxID=2316728 RepID=A0A3A8KA01_9BACT|nr:hypothetical protein [Corallococcus carmarthensis]RKH05048.1 hypothetical protein D7X32_09010 [Corallococcus carmarthensis]